MAKDNGQRALMVLASVLAIACASCSEPANENVEPPKPILVLSAPEKPNVEDLTDSELRSAISSDLDLGIYFAIATAQMHALRCDQPAKAVELETRLLRASALAVSTTDLVQRKLDDEQLRCCKLLGEEWDIRECDVAAATEALNEGERRLVKLEALAVEYGRRLNR